MPPGENGDCYRLVNRTSGLTRAAVTAWKYAGKLTRTFCTLVVLFGVGMVQGIAPPSEVIRVKGANAILAMGIFSINRHKQSDIFMKK